jgi:hypothetical protein
MLAVPVGRFALGWEPLMGRAAGQRYSIGTIERRSEPCRPPASTTTSRCSSKLSRRHIAVRTQRQSSDQGDQRDHDRYEQLA